MSQQCVACKGAKLLCGKDRCPLLIKFFARSKNLPLINSTRIGGSSPPGVFIGSYGYPKVAIGPLIPPVQGDTLEMDTPEMWADKTIDEIADFRFQLVRGKFAADVHDVESRNKIVERTRELALAKSSVLSDAEFLKKPFGTIKFDDNVQPFGPSAPLRALETENVKFDQDVEKAFFDTDLKAAPAALGLYEKGLEVSRIQKAFSVGAFGVEKNRKFVPTRWSITAVDSLLSQNLLDHTKEAPLINEFRVYEHVQLDNRWVVLMMPRAWSYELIEAWWPKTIWNPAGKEIFMIASHESFEGRKTYAEIGGCYYAARLAINEKLIEEDRQAAVVVLRESLPGYVMPVGVWLVRQSVREALKKDPLKFNSLADALTHVQKTMEIPLQRWIRQSEVLRETLYQKKLTDF